ncbi:MAG: non-oxidative hydroxyarylic acid decarboxylases subunit D [Desulfosporosinus sp.]|nr:non-oxidative hydroxyarylic acid decarboxylases subunit D [Desulfosporosinus sp.]
MICPRCDSNRARVMVTSPVGNEWEVYVCEKCWFSWRSTEKIKVNPKFKLNDQKIAEMLIIPPIPPLKINDDKG